MTAPHADPSPTRAAGLPPISTVEEPRTIGVDPCTTAGGHMNQQTWRVPTVAAGFPAIRTVGTPGPAIIPPGWFVTSPSLAANGIVSS
jgi:hypothetical protein